MNANKGFYQCAFMVIRCIVLIKLH